MPITPAQVAAAEAAQHAAAHDGAAQVRLVAGPGTGKSASIEERVCWLISQGIAADAICAVSFTRASARDLRTRIHGYATKPGYTTVNQVAVTTLHSLATSAIAVWTSMKLPHLKVYFPRIRRSSRLLKAKSHKK